MTVLRSPVNGGDGSTTSTYTANALNRYDSRTVAGSVGVSGLAPASETVSVKIGTTDQGTVSRISDFFYKSVSASNGTAPVWLGLNVSSASGGTVYRNTFIPPASEPYAYDDDGNLLSDGRWTYTWDAENRLTSMETNSLAYGAGAPRQFLSFKYDHLGRRVRKTVANWSGSAYVAVVDRKFIYDGWNLIAEADVLSIFTVVRTYVWGIDISRTLSDAAGVHGLLQIKDAATSQTYQTIYDGNGNLIGLVQRSSGTIAAMYEYSPFGELIRATGTYAGSNPFRFSTKFTDDESGLVYYGRRYYNPSQGRFLGRDPKRERGGIHLYAFCQNNSVNLWDYVGMAPSPGSNDWAGPVVNLPAFGVSATKWSAGAPVPGDPGYDPRYDGDNPSFGPTPTTSPDPQSSIGDPYDPVTFGGTAPTPSKAKRAAPGYFGQDTNSACGAAAVLNALQSLSGGSSATTLETLKTFMTADQIKLISETGDGLGTPDVVSIFNPAASAAGLKYQASVVLGTDRSDLTRTAAESGNLFFTVNNVGPNTNHITLNIPIPNAPGSSVQYVTVIDSTTNGAVQYDSFASDTGSGLINHGTALTPSYNIIVITPIATTPSH